VPVYYQIPDDPYYDFVPIAGPGIQLGMDVLSVLRCEGTVQSASSIGVWAFPLSMDTPWGVPISGVALYPIDPHTQPANWWQRLAMWTRTAKLADGAMVTVTDGSRWKYAANEDGLMLCVKSGTQFTRGQRLARGSLTTDPKDLLTADDAAWDWLPVKDGATVSVSDYVSFAWPQAGVVDNIATAELTPGYVRTAIQYDGADLGFFDTITDPTIPALAMTCDFYQRLLKPVTWTDSRAPDGSRWTYNGTAYACWGKGTAYSPGAIFRRGEITGLVDLPNPAPSLPPQIREVLQTRDDLTASATLTTSPSVVTGDVLLIIYACDVASPTVPTSSAGTCTQVGTDAHDAIDDGMVRVYRCPVGSDGPHTIDVAAQSTAVVLVLADDAAVDGFGKANFDPPVVTATLPSVSPTGDTDLLVGVYYDATGKDLGLSGSGLVQRANPKVTTFNRLSVGTVELESSDPTAAAYPTSLADYARPATLAIAMKRP